MFYSAAFITLLKEGINWYHQHYSDTLNNWPSPVPDITESEMLPFLAIIIPLGQDIQGCLKDYWTGMNSSWHHFTASKTMIHDRVLHIIGYLHFSISDNATDNNDPNYELWWKIRCFLRWWMTSSQIITHLPHIWLWKESQYFSQQLLKEVHTQETQTFFFNL